MKQYQAAIYSGEFMIDEITTTHTDESVVLAEYPQATQVVFVQVKPKPINPVLLEKIKATKPHHICEQEEDGSFLVQYNLVWMPVNDLLRLKFFADKFGHTLYVKQINYITVKFEPK